ncbi:MAG: hypothetical protein J6W16_02395, partial [Methanobrevibacter sp.]|nr:hypothetical protein [Methanobrevibacter sp.]
MIDTIVGEGGIEKISQDLFEQLNNATNDYNNYLAEIETTGNRTFESIKKGTDEALENEQKLLKVNQDLIDTYEKQIDAVEQVYESLKKMIEEYKQSAKAAQE